VTRLYNRQVVVTLARPVAEGPQGFFRQQPNAIVVRDLRVQFSLEKNLEKDPNTCEVTISNMSEATRAEVQRKPLHVRLEAGYDGQLERLFAGDLRWAQSKLAGTDWETSLSLGDGERALRHARVTRSFRAGIDVKTVLQETAASMGLRLPKSVQDAKELLGQFSGGLTLHGPSQAEMERLLKPRGMGYSVQDGQLQILRAGEARVEQAAIISQDTGLIGTPELGAPKEPGKPPVLTLTTLLYPRLTPGGRIQVEARSVRGLFRVTMVRHEGDTHGDSWTTSMEATPLS
jgi:hypothetical protein